MADWRKGLARSYVPAMLVVGNGTAIAVVSLDSSWIWLLLLGALAIGSSFLAERLLPFRADWNHSHGDAARDLVHATVNESLSALSVWSVPVFSLMVPSAGIWPSDWPLTFQWLLAVLVADCGITLAHFASHRWNILWRLHAVHHSVERMYGFNGLMKHPLHQGIETIAGVSPLLAVGIPQDVATLLAFSVTLQLLLQHSNVDVELGIFQRWLALGPTHRLHHLADPIRGDVNFGLFTSIWDRLLGTARFEPWDGPVGTRLGVADRPDYPAKYLSQLVEPFRPSVRANGS